MTALRGNLNSVDLANVFQMLSMNQREGTLYIHSADGRKALHFGPGGVSLLARTHSQQEALGRILIRQDWATSDQITEALRRQEDGSGRLLGQVLVEQGIVTRQHVEDALRIQVEEEIYGLFLAEGAQFEFQEGETPPNVGAQGPPGAKRVTFNVNSLIMEAAQRIDEWEWIRSVVPNTRIIFRYSGKNVALEDPIFQDARAGKVLAAVDGRRNVDGIILASFVSRFDTCKILGLLLEANALERVPVAALREAAEECLAAGDTVEATKFLSQIIEGQGDTPETHRQLAELLESEREFAQAAFHYRVFAEVRVDAGDHAEAFQIYERIHEFLPTDLAAADRMLEVYTLNPDGLERRAAEMIELGTQIASIYADLSRPSRAIQVLHRVVSLAPEDLGLRKALIDIYLATGLTGEAIAEYDAMAETSLALGDDKAAEETYRRILALDRTREDVRARLNKLLQKQTRARQTKRRAFLVTLLLLLLATASAAGWSFYTQYRTKRTQADLESTTQFQRAGQAHAGTVEELRVALAQFSACVGDPDALFTLRRERPDGWTDLKARVNNAVHDYLVVAKKAGGTEAAAHAQREADALRAQLRQITQLEDDAEDVLSARAQELLAEAERLDPLTTRTSELHAKYAEAKVYAECCPRFLATERGKQLMAWESDLRHNLAAFETTRTRVGEQLANGDPEGAFDLAMTYLSDYPPTDLAGQIGVPVYVTSQPAGATVLVNGVEAGFTNGWVLIAPKADAHIELKRSGYDTHVIDQPTIQEGNPRVLRRLIQRELNVVLSKSVSFRSPPLGAEITTVTVVGERAIATTRGDKQEMLRLPQGQIGWPLATPNPGGVVARPVASGSTVAVSGVDGVVYFFDVESRTALGTVQTDGQVWSDPVLVGSNLVVADLNGHLLAIDIETRDVAWRYPANGASALASGFRADLATAGEYVIAAEQGGTVHVLDARSGRRTLQFSMLPTAANGTIQGIAVAGDLIVGLSDRGDLVRARRADGVLLPSVELGIAPRGGPLVDGDFVYVVGRLGQVRAVSLLDGTVTAGCELGASVGADAALCEGVLMVGDDSGRLTALRIAGDRIEQVWQYTVPHQQGQAIPIVSPPVPYGDRVLFGGGDRRVHAIAR